MRFFLVVFFLFSFVRPASTQSLGIEGAWESSQGENRTIMIIASRYFSAAVYHKTSGAYLGTCGGTWKIERDVFKEVHEFNTLTPAWVGTELKSQISVQEKILVFTTKDEVETFTRIDNGTPGQLAGAWIITGRTTSSGLQKITPGPRKTMKILSGTRFQWIAYHTETKEFFGTGGGKRTADQFKVPLLAEIPIDLTIREGGDNGTPVACGETKVAQIFHGLALKLVEILAKKQSAEPMLKIIN